MVYFTCDACGQSLKKNQVEKHYQFQCRSCSVLSCVDCGKDFPGDTYTEHTKCISEEEKYSGKNFTAKPNANKGERKQEQWIEQVQGAIDKAKTNQRLKGVLLKIKDFPNIPRKKAKFENFLRSSMNIRDNYAVSQAWDAINIELSKNDNQASETKNTENTGTNKSVPDTEESMETENGVQESETKKLNKRERKEERKKLSKKEKKEKNTAGATDEGKVQEKKKKKGKKRKLSEDDACEDMEAEKQAEERTQDKQESEVSSSLKKKKMKKNRQKHENGQPQEKEIKEMEVDVEEEDEEEAPSPVPKFSWEDTIVALLKRAEGKEMSVKRLRKKVLSEYNACGGDGKTKCEEKLLARFTRKITKNPRLKVLKEKVKLVH